MKVLRDTSGQIFVLGAVLIVVMIGMLGLVVDVGAWLHAKRTLQTAVDAAALAGAQNLPNMAAAQDAACGFIEANGRACPSPDVEFPPPSGCAGPCIAVTASQSVTGVFTRVIDAAFGTVTVGARAQAASFVPSTMNQLAPVAIQASNACQVAMGTCPMSATLDLDNRNSAAIVDLSGGGASPGTVAGWFPNDPPHAVSLGDTYPVASNLVVRNQGIRGAFRSAVGRPLVVAVADFNPATMSAPASYTVIGWAAFVPTSVPSGFAWRRGDHSVSGQFVTNLVDTDEPAAPPGTTNFGVYTVRIVG